MRDACNAVARQKSDLQLARQIRAFRPGPVAAVSDAQLAGIVSRSRDAARAFGIRNDALVLKFVMVDALIEPLFYEKPEVSAHFRQASGTPDIKMGDLFQLMKLTMQSIGRGDEVWW